jgi:acyl-CoA synthetase (NDP forming)
MQGLSYFTAPRSIAIVGASESPDKIGGRPLSFLLRAGFPGQLLPVNPRAGTVQGLPALASVDLLPAGVELAIVALPGPLVAQAMDQLAEKGVRAAIVFSSDLAAGETSAIVSRAKARGLRTLGPNTLGLFSTGSGCFATFATALDGSWPRSGPIAVVSQSGAFGSYLYALIDNAGGGISHMITTGNGADLDLPEIIDALASDGETTVVVIAFEGVRDGRALVDAIARLRAAGKPVVAMKSGRSAAGKKAAATHTGALAGDDAVLDAALHAAGALPARTMQEAAHLAAALARGLRMAGPRLGVVTTSGGVGVLASDYAEEAGLVLPELPDGTRVAIRSFLPMAGLDNPVDSSTGILSDFGLFGRLVEAVQTSGRYDGLLLYLAHIGRNPKHWAGVEPAIRQARARRPDMPLVVSMLAPEGPRRSLSDMAVPVFEDPADAVRLIGLLAALPQPDPPADVRQPASPLPAGPLSEAAAMSWLEAEGLPTPRRALAATPEEAQSMAPGIGATLAVKVVSADIAHKSEAGGVRLGVAADRAGAAFAEVTEAASRSMPQARLDGVMLAEMVAPGPEIIVGTLQDPAFGAVVMVGLGGVAAEALRDAAFALAPIGREAALALIARLRGRELLSGFRGGPVADLPALADIVSRVSHLAAWGRPAGLQIEINPVRIAPDGRPVCLDALVVTDNTKGTTP